MFTVHGTGATPVRMNLRKRRGAILKAVEQYGYRQQEIADHLGLHYSSVSRIVKGERWSSHRKT
jgi:transposase